MRLGWLLTLFLFWLLGENQEEGDKFRVLNIANLIELADLEIEAVIFEERILCSTHEEVEQGIENVGLKQADYQEFTIRRAIEYSALLSQIFGVGVLRFGIRVEADSIKATFINDGIESVILISHIQEVHLSVRHSRDTSLVHFSDHVSNEIDTGDISLIHHCAKFLRKERITAAGNQDSLRVSLNQAILEVWNQILKVGVPFERLHIRALIVLVYLLGFEEIGPEVLTLELFRVFRLKVECL